MVSCRFHTFTPTSEAEAKGVKVLLAATSQAPPTPMIEEARSHPFTVSKQAKQVLQQFKPSQL
jgi:hypothetical protein